MADASIDPLDLLTWRTVLVDGRRLVNLFSDGTVLPVVRGGDGDEGAGGEGEGESDGGAGGSEGEGEGSGEPAKLSLTQAELDEMISKAKASAKKTAADEAKQAAERAKMDETDRLKAEKADADKASAEREAKANARIVRTEAKVAAIAAGVDAKEVGDFLDLMKLDAIDVGDDGEVDAKALKKAVDAVLAKPTFKAAFTGGGKGGASGGEFNGDGEKHRPANLEDAVSARLAS